MDKAEFRQLLDLFPVVRSRDYHAELDSSRQVSQLGPSEEVVKWNDALNIEEKREAFWKKLKSAAEKKVGPSDAEKFCKAFQQVYKKLVYEDLTLDAATRLMNSRNS